MLQPSIESKRGAVSKFATPETSNVPCTESVCAGDVEATPRFPDAATTSDVVVPVSVDDATSKMFALLLPCAKPCTANQAVEEVVAIPTRIVVVGVRIPVAFISHVCPNDAQLGKTAARLGVEVYTL